MFGVKIIGRLINNQNSHITHFCISPRNLSSYLMLHVNIRQICVFMCETLHYSEMYFWKLISYNICIHCSSWIFMDIINVTDISVSQHSTLKTFNVTFRVCVNCMKIKPDKDVSATKKYFVLLQRIILYSTRAKVHETLSGHTQKKQFTLLFLYLRIFF